MPVCFVADYLSFICVLFVGIKMFFFNSTLRTKEIKEKLFLILLLPLKSFNLKFSIKTRHIRHRM